MSRPRSLFHSLNLQFVGRRLVLGSLVGAVAGLGAIAFNLACGVAVHWFLDEGAGYRPAQPVGEHEYFAPTDTPFTVWLLPVMAALGGLLSGLVCYLFAREATGHGTDSAIDAYHNKDGHISGAVPLVKLFASALTIGAGGSGGREGPIAQIGAGFGSFLATRLKLSARERRILLASGMGAGVGSIFHAPLAGALFAAEILYSEAEFESDALIPAAMSTIIAYSVFSLHSGFDPLFATPDLRLDSLWELIPYTFLALLAALGAGLFVKVFYGTEALFQRLPLHPVARPAVGGAIAGTIGALLYLGFADPAVLDVLSFGYGTLQDSMLGNAPIAVMAVLAVGKMVTTSISIGSGGSGGVFGPSMVIGGSLGGIVGYATAAWFPDVVSHPGSYVVVGMAGFFAAAGKVPISTLVMVSEMTGSYRLLLPSLWVSALAFLFGRQWRLYRSQVPSRMDSAAHRHEMFVDLLEGTKVAAVAELDQEIVTLHQATPLNEIVHVFARTTQHYFPVVDEEGLMVGLLSANDVRQFIEEQGVGGLVIASDLAVTEVVTLLPTDDLQAALQRFVSLDVGALPVVDEDEPRRVRGLVLRRDLIHAYNNAREGLKAKARADDMSQGSAGD